jgi:glycosyltransferase involved in cell wall biosynthesis
MIGIVIATYPRPDGKTPFFLNRALKSIEEQIYKDYKVFIIGDGYPGDELTGIISKYSKIVCFNLSYSVERVKYKFGDYKLYCSGGVTPIVIGITEALKECEYICHLDHDDWWEPNHLFLISKVLLKNPFFVCTLSTYKSNEVRPLIKTRKIFTEYYPEPYGIVPSSTCIKYSETSLRSRDVFQATGKAVPADADLWERLTKEMKAKGRIGIAINTVTCHHDTEGYSWHLK